MYFLEVVHNKKYWMEATYPSSRLKCLQVILTYTVALVIKRIIPTERPPLVGEVSANFCG
jgi:hypothetical protein